MTMKTTTVLALLAAFVAARPEVGLLQALQAELSSAEDRVLFDAFSSFVQT